MDCLDPSDKLQQRRRWTNIILITASTTTCRGYCHLSGKNPFLLESKTGARNWYGLKLLILCSKRNHNRYFPMSLIEWKKFIYSWEMSRSVAEPFCWGLRKLDFNSGLGSIPLCELESQLSFEMEVSAGNFWDLWMKNAASLFPMRQILVMYWDQKCHIACWHSVRAGVLPVRSVSLRCKLEGSSTEAAWGWNLKWIS